MSDSLTDVDGRESSSDSGIEMSAYDDGTNGGGLSGASSSSAGSGMATPSSPSSIVAEMDWPG